MLRLRVSRKNSVCMRYNLERYTVMNPTILNISKGLYYERLLLDGSQVMQESS